MRVGVAGLYEVRNRNGFREERFALNGKDHRVLYTGQIPKGWQMDLSARAQEDYFVRPARKEICLTTVPKGNFACCCISFEISRPQKESCTPPRRNMQAQARRFLFNGEPRWAPACSTAISHCDQRELSAEPQRQKQYHCRHLLTNSSE